MEYPSSKPDDAFLSSEADAAASNFPEYLFDPALQYPVSGSELHHPANPLSAANPNADVAIGPSTCRSQPAHAASRVGTIDLSSRLPFGQGPCYSVSHAPQTAVPLQQLVLSHIARLYASANVAPRTPGRSQQTPHPTQPPGFRPTWSGRTADPAAPWLSVNPNPGVTPNAFDPPQHGLQEPLHPGAFQAVGPPYPLFSLVSSLSPALDSWAPPATPVYNSTPGSETAPQSTSAAGPASGLLHAFDDGVKLPPDGRAAAWPGPSYPPTPISHVSDDVADIDHTRRASTDSASVAVSHGSAPDAWPPGQRERKRPRQSPTPSLTFVQCNPSGSGGTTPRKRRAVEETTLQGISSQPLRTVLFHDDYGEVKGTIITFGNRVRTRAPFSEEKRQKTALARKEGVCRRCKKSKRQCDLAHKQSLYVSCTLCAGTKIYKNAPRLPCFRAALEDILLFRAGPAPNEPFFTTRNIVYQLKDLTEPDTPVRTLRLTQRIGRHQLTVYASEFKPVTGDVISYKWRDRLGGRHELKMPHYCLTNMEKIHSHFLHYIAQAKWSYLQLLEEDDELAWMTVSAAMLYATKRPNSLVADALSLWAISRMIEIPWQMCGPDTLGLSPVGDPTSPHYGKIPIPPTMDTQLDQVVIKLILNPLRAQVLRKFEQLISPPQPETWWEVYLSSFILLNHIERLARHSVFHSRTHTLASKYSNIPFLEGAFHAAKCILARFHFVCNGSAPLRLDWTSSKVTAMAKLEPNQVAFMRRTQAMVAAREQQVLRLRSTHLYERTLYWSGQLFAETFDTSPVHVVEEVDGDE